MAANVVAIGITASLVTFGLWMIWSAIRDWRSTQDLLSKLDVGEDEDEEPTIINWKGSSIETDITPEEQHLLATTPVHFANRFIIVDATVRRGDVSLKYQRVCVMSIPDEGGTPVMLGSYLISPKSARDLRDILDYQLSSKEERARVLHPASTTHGGSSGAVVVPVRHGAHD